MTSSKLQMQLPDDMLQEAGMGRPAEETTKLIF